VNERWVTLDLIHCLATRTIVYPYKVWGYGEAIGLEGLLAAADATGAPAYFQFVHGLIDAWVAARPEIGFADHVAPGQVLLAIYERTGDERLLRQALRLARFFAGLPRSPEGAALHRPDHPEFAAYVYVDCLAVDAPFLCHLAQLTGDAQFFRLATDLLLGHIRVLQDQTNGLFYHLYDSARRQTNGAFWGRGNGWAILGLLATLERLPHDDPAQGTIRTALERQAAALVKVQDESGHWHTVLDRPDTSLEASVSAFLSAALTHGVRVGLLPGWYLDTADRAWSALRTSVDANGTVAGVSQATPPGDAAHYNQVPTGGLYPWGQGPALLAATERLMADGAKHA